MSYQSHVEKTMLTGPDGPSRKTPLTRIALGLAAAAVVSSALHFWPLENSRWWQILCVQNGTLIVWVLVLAAWLILTRKANVLSQSLPHVSVFAYVAINVLSIAFARDFGRSTQFVVKLGLVLIAGYSLFHTAIGSPKSRRGLWVSICLAAALGVGSTLVTRFVLGSERFGFFDSPYKYGTYIASLASLGSAYLLLGAGRAGRVAGAALLLAAVVSSGTLGALVGLSAGALVLAYYAPRQLVRVSALSGPALAAGIALGAAVLPPFSHLREDIRLRESDGTNLRQRYIEWQAEINLLELRAATGAGAGSLNDYRSEFYLRLPKLNTLRPFDFNGWLSVGAETGVVGLMCFCWIVMHHLRLARERIRSGSPDEFRGAAAGLAGLVAACAANVFSALQHNGVLIVMALVLALIAGSERVCRE